MSDVLDRLKTAERTAEKFTGGVAIFSRQTIVDAVAEIERLQQDKFDLLELLVDARKEIELLRVASGDAGEVME